MDLRRLERGIVRGDVDAAFYAAALQGAVPPMLTGMADRLLRDEYRRQVTDYASIIGWDHQFEGFRRAASAIRRSRFVTSIPQKVMSDLATIDPSSGVAVRVGWMFQRESALSSLEEMIDPDDQRALQKQGRRTLTAFSLMLRDVVDAAADAGAGGQWIGERIQEARRPPNTAFVYSCRDSTGWRSREEVVFRGRVAGWGADVLSETTKFIPSAFGLPMLCGDHGDPPRHEFERVYLTADPATDKRSIAKFVQEFVLKPSGTVSRP